MKEIIYKILNKCKQYLFPKNSSKKTSGYRNEQAFLKRMTELSRTEVGDTAIPRADIIAAPETISITELVKLFTKTKFLYLPIYREALDQILGIICLKDILGLAKNRKIFHIHTILKQVLFVSPTMRLLDLFFQMHKMKHPLAIVVDEHGGVDGIITFSRLLSKLVGNLQADPQKNIQYCWDGSIVADARTRVELLQNSFPYSILKDHKEVETLGGIVVSIAGHVPLQGEKIRHSSGIEFEILESDMRKVKRLKFYPTVKD
ncbi:MAG: CBS domain-containing protein [Alphaproteobacteria bacterium]